MELLKEEEPENENEYIAMSNHLKELYDQIDLKNKKLTFEKMELQKILMSAYGMSRVIDYLTSNIMDIPADLVLLIEHLRGFLSDELDNHVFNIRDLTFD